MRKLGHFAQARFPQTRFRLNFALATGKELRPEPLAPPSFVPFASLGNVRSLAGAFGRASLVSRLCLSMQVRAPNYSARCKMRVQRIHLFRREGDLHGLRIFR